MPSIFHWFVCFWPKADTSAKCRFPIVRLTRYRVSPRQPSQVHFFNKTPAPQPGGTQPALFILFEQFKALHAPPGSAQRWGVGQGQAGQPGIELSIGLTRLNKPSQLRLLGIAEQQLAISLQFMIENRVQLLSQVSGWLEGAATQMGDEQKSGAGGDDQNSWPASAGGEWGLAHSRPVLRNGRILKWGAETAAQGCAVSSVISGTAAAGCWCRPAGSVRVRRSGWCGLRATVLRLASSGRFRCRARR